LTRALLLAVACAICACLPSAAGAAQKVTISAGFAPERLGAATTLSLGFRIASTEGALPSPLTGIDLHYPPDLGLATSGLGVATCDPAQLEAVGATVCPANSLMGYGSALVEFQIGVEFRDETAQLDLFAGPSQNGYVRILVYAVGITPIDAQILFSTLLLPGQLQFDVPVVPGIPEGPDVSVIRVRTTLGGDLTYYRYAHGRRVAYRPAGVGLPPTCPRGGFRFAATFSFLDGTRANAGTTVPCPVRRSPRAKRDIPIP
jgi:hypothetical protein